MRARAFRQRLLDLALPLSPSLSVSHLAQRSPVARSLQCLVARLPGCLGRQVAAAQQVGRRQVPRRIIANHLSNKWTKSRYATTNESRVELRWVRALTATAVQWAEVDIFMKESIQVWISWLFRGWKMWVELLAAHIFNCIVVSHAAWETRNDVLETSVEFCLGYFSHKMFIRQHEILKTVFYAG